MIPPEIYVGLETSVPMKDRIIRAVCDVYEKTYEELKSRCKKRELYEPRQLIEAIDYMIKKEKNWNANIQETANIFLHDHSTISHSIRTVYNLYTTNCYYREKADLVLSKLGLCPDFIKSWVLEKRERY